MSDPQTQRDVFHFITNLVYRILACIKTWCKNSLKMA